VVVGFPLEATFEIIALGNMWSGFLGVGVGDGVLADSTRDDDDHAHDKMCAYSAARFFRGSLRFKCYGLGARWI